MRAKFGLMQTLAGGASATLILPVTEHSKRLKVLTAALFGGTVAGTNGVQTKISSSADNGTTYVDVPGESQTIAGVVSTAGTSVLSHDGHFHKVGGSKSHYKITLTNLDATNGVTVTLAYEQGEVN